MKELKEMAGALSASQMDQKLNRILETVQKPARYTGGEMNGEVKAYEPGFLRFAFCFPDSYEVAMSHLGLKILWDIVNQKPDMICERVCMPWTDMMEKMAEEGLPLFSLESRTPLNQFDVVGFTLQYEMSYTNILHMLKMGGIAVYSKDRAQNDSIVVAGGPCAFNPEPLSPFIDAFMIGDGESSLPELLQAVKQGREAGLERQAILKSLSQIPGVYVPLFYEAEYDAQGRLLSFRALEEGLPLPIQKRVELSLEDAPFPESIPVPYTEIVHDRIVLEIMRGCTRGCRFCQAGTLYRPVRERSPETLFKLAQKLVSSTGYEEISLSSLSSGDYSRLNELVRGLNERLKQKRVRLSLPSLRVDGDLKSALLDTAEVKKSGLTLAPEAGTQRLRDVINKGVTEEDLLRTVGEAFDNGWSSVKLYFMMGLPTETDEDLLGIADLARKVVARYYAAPKEKRGKGLKVTVSCAVFVPKPFTPFEWVPQNTPEEIERKQLLLREALKIKGVNFNWHDSKLSFMEACFARGDRRLAGVLARAFELGCRLDGWSEEFRYDLWLKAFEEEGLDPRFYACREREKDELLPWRLIDAGVTPSFLWREWEKAQAAKTTKDCRQGCQGCGLTRFKGVCGS